MVLAYYDGGDTLWLHTGHSFVMILLRPCGVGVGAANNGAEAEIDLGLAAHAEHDARWHGAGCGRKPDTFSASAWTGNPNHRERPSVDLRGPSAGWGNRVSPRADIRGFPMPGILRNLRKCALADDWAAAQRRQVCFFTLWSPPCVS